MNNEEICQRFDALESERKGTVEQIWDLVERFVLPLRGDFYSSLTDEGEVDWHRRQLYDSTAVYACQSLAASLHGNLTSPSQRWFDLRFREDALNRDDKAKEWLEDTSQRIYNALSEANFDIEIAEAYLDIVGFGTAALTEELDEQTGKLTFAAVPVREIFFEEDHNKQIHRLYRRLEWTPVQIAAKFGEENLPRDIKEKLDNPSSSTEKMTVIFAIYPRDIPNDLDLSKPVAPKSRPYGYKYILKTGQETLGEEGGYYEMPAFITRWRKTSGSRWGHSPATTAMADILLLNQIKEATLEAAGKAIDPANLAEESAILGDLDLDRGALNIVTNIDGIRPYESGTRFDVSNMEIGMLIDSIRKAFHQDQLELKESPAMTATEVNVRYELMQRLLGPSFARLKSDLLDPLIQRAFAIMFRAGMLLELPEQLEGVDMDIEYSGPLPRSQQFDSAIAIQNFMMSMAQFADVFPESLDVVDTDNAVRTMAILQGVPAKALRGERDIKKMRDDKAKAQQEQQQVMEAQAQGEAMRSVGEGMQAVEGADPSTIANIAGAA